MRKPLVGLYLLLSGAVAFGQGTSQTAIAKDQGDKASAYYYYTLGHLYSEMAGLYGNRGDYISKAIDNYRQAMKADPEARFLADELSDLYIQSGRYREALTDSEDAIKQNPDDLNARRVLARIYTRLIGGDSQQNRIDEDMLKKSIEQYQKIVQKDPKDTDSWLMLGRLFKVQQNSVESEKAFKKAIDLEPDNEDALTGLALVYADLGDTKSATDLLKRVAEKNPSVRSLTSLASAYEQMHEYALAAQTYRRAIEMSQGDTSELQHALAQNLLLAERYDEALQLYQQMVDDDPHDVQSWLRMSQIYRQQHNFAKAHEANDKARAQDPNNLEIRYNEVNLLETEGKTGDAINVLKDMLDSTAKRSYSPADKSNRVVLMERLGMMYRSNEQFDLAIKTFKQMSDLDPDVAPRVSAQVIDTYRLAKDFPHSEQEADAAAKKYPNDRTVRAVRASLLADLGKFDQAVAETKKLMDGKSDHDTYIALAQVYERAKRWDEMGKVLDEAEKLSQSKDDKENVHFMRGAMLERMKKYDAAEAEFRKVLEINPESAAALNYLGYMLADRNVRLQEAQQMISKAVGQEPNNAAYLDSLGWVDFRLGKFPEAEDNLKRSLERSSKDPTVHDHLGDVYFRQGKLKDAIAQWESSLKNWDTSAPADLDPTEVAKVQKKLEGAKVRLAKEGSAVKQ